MILPWADPSRALPERARLLLDAADEANRGALKRLGSWIDAQDEAMRAAIVAEGRRRGAALPDEAVTWPGKRLLRLARSHEDQARERRNPIRRDEGFVCSHCGVEVVPHGRTARDHCPACLRSLHVDVVPGDRAADCGGILDPVAADQRGGDWVLTYRCRDCGAMRVNRALLDGDPPDDWAAVVALASSGAAGP